MKKRNKLLSMLLVLAMLLALTACSGSGTETTQPPADGQQTETPDGEVTEPDADDENADEQNEEKQEAEQPEQPEEEENAPAENEEPVIGEEGENPPEPIAPDVDYKVAVVADPADPSASQTVIDACQAFCEDNGIEFWSYQPAEDSEDARCAMLDAAVADGYNIVVLPGSGFAATLVARSSRYFEDIFLALNLEASDILSAAGASPDADAANYYNTDNVCCSAGQENLDETVQTLLTEIILNGNWSAYAGQILS